MCNYTVYILHSAQLDKYYIGFTATNVALRLSKHLANHNGFTAKAKDWKIAFSKSFVTKAEALAEEKKLKAWKSNIRISAYILRSSND